ncbi:hypothetical protein PIROE2DRAFT_69706, partial [Piromyces sp. E2]
MDSKDDNKKNINKDEEILHSTAKTILNHNNNNTVHHSDKILLRQQSNGRDISKSISNHYISNDSLEKGDRTSAEIGYFGNQINSVVNSPLIESNIISNTSSKSNVKSSNEQI